MDHVWNMALGIQGTRQVGANFPEQLTKVIPYTYTQTQDNSPALPNKLPYYSSVK